MASAPRDGTEIDLWSRVSQSRLCCIRFIKAADVDARYAPGGDWAHLAQDGWRRSKEDDSTLCDEQFTHWRLTAEDRPAGC